MKYKKLLKKAAVSLLLAQSLIFTGLPIQAADIAGQSMVQKMMTARLAMEVQKAMPARLAMEVRKTMPVSQAMPAS